MATHKMGGDSVVTNTLEIEFTDGTIQTTAAIPILVLALDAETQSAALSSTVIATPDLDGLYLISAYARVSQSATTSSTLGPVTVAWQDADSNTAVSQVPQLLTNKYGLTTQSGVAVFTGGSTATVTFGTAYVGTTAPIVTVEALSSSGAALTRYVTMTGSSGAWTGFTLTLSGNLFGGFNWVATGPGGQGLNSLDSSNAVGAGLLGSVVINVKAGNPINISLGYSSSGGTAMQYAYHFKAVLIGATP